MKKHRPKSAGFTLVEIMIAIGIMTVGSLGIIAMHGAVSQGNRDSREMITALALSQTWLERFERDALSWNAATSILDIGLTTYLRPLALTPTGTGWLAPNSGADANTANDFEVPGADFFGRDWDAANGVPVKYCVNYRLSWIRQGSSARVDVRTYWVREGHNPAPAGNWAANPALTVACAPAQADAWNLDPANPNAAANINVVYASTVVRWTPRDDT
jgi:prepilin-type N-terminal cleavage/methylation domain-containing protein